MKLKLEECWSSKGHNHDNHKIRLALVILLGEEYPLLIISDNQ